MSNDTLDMADIRECVSNLENEEMEVTKDELKEVIEALVKVNDSIGELIKQVNNTPEGDTGSYYYIRTKERISVLRDVLGQSLQKVQEEAEYISKGNKYIWFYFEYEDGYTCVKKNYHYPSTPDVEEHMEGYDESEQMEGYDGSDFIEVEPQFSLIEALERIDDILGINANEMFVQEKYDSLSLRWEEL